MAVRPLLLAACAWLCLVTSSTAHAYCRTHTLDPAASSCPELCTEEGLPLAWFKPNLTYTFNQRGFPGLSADALRGVFNASFQTWENVRCDGEPIGLDIRARASATTLEVGPERAEPNDNVIVHFTSAQWDEQNLPSQAFAITAVWFNATDGEILGADMMFNGGMDPFGECDDDGCAARQPGTDLRNVATHEIGHFLGLSHSDVPNSTMWCDAEAREISKRSLAPDDIEGLCAVYPAESAFQDQDEGGGGRRRVLRSCALSPTTTPTDEPGLGLLAGGLALTLGLVLRRRRRG